MPLEQTRRAVANSAAAFGRALITLVLADSYPMLLEAMAQVFSAEAGFRVLVSCPNGEEALRACANHQPDVLVLDLDVPESGLTVLRRLGAQPDPPRVILMASRLDSHEMFEAIRLGARGIFLKSMPRHLLIQCARKVHSGEMWLERVSMASAVDHLIREEAGCREVGALLTQRELQIVRLVAAGRSTREIADTIDVAAGTVKAHLHHVYEKLGVRGRLELTLLARDRGLFSPLHHV
jgi:DNA-binding NarL/FixJ family response regulator